MRSKKKRSSGLMPVKYLYEYVFIIIVNNVGYEMEPQNGLKPLS